MKRITIVLGLMVGAAGCEALEPEWSHVQGVSEVNPYPDATCDDICEIEGRLCLENSCDGATLAAYSDLEAAAPDALVPAACDMPLREIVGGDGGWQATIACCCTSGAE